MIEFERTVLVPLAGLDGLERLAASGAPTDARLGGMRSRPRKSARRVSGSGTVRRRAARGSASSSADVGIQLLDPRPGSRGPTRRRGVPELALGARPGALGQRVCDRGGRGGSRLVRRLLGVISLIAPDNLQVSARRRTARGRADRERHAVRLERGRRMAAPTKIETERLVLRRPRLSDATALHAVLRRSRGHALHRRRHDAHAGQDEGLDREGARPLEGGRLRALRDREGPRRSSGASASSSGTRDEWRTGNARRGSAATPRSSSAGCSHREHWGNGYATEAASAAARLRRSGN